MKKKSVFLLSLIMILSFSVLTACGGGGGSSEDLSDSKYVGTWKAGSMSFADESDEIEEEYMLTINGDGTGQMTGSGEVSEFTWSPTDDGFKTKGDVKTTFKEDGDDLVTKIIGVELRFVKTE